MVGASRTETLAARQVDDIVEWTEVLRCESCKTLCLWSGAESTGGRYLVGLAVSERWIEWPPDARVNNHAIVNKSLSNRRDCKTAPCSL